MVKIVVVNGMPMSGKSQFVEYCLKELGIYGEEVSTVDFVKELAKLSGWDGVKRPRDRKFLSDLKDLLTEWNDVPYKKIIEARDKLQDHLDYLGYDANKGIIFTHCREPEEIERFEKELGAKSVFIDREESKKEQSNHADSRVENYSYTYIIDDNEDLEHLRKSAETFIKILRGELKIDFSI